MDNKEKANVKKLILIENYSMIYFLLSELTSREKLFLLISRMNKKRDIFKFINNFSPFFSFLFHFSFKKYNY